MNPADDAAFYFNPMINLGPGLPGILQNFVIRGPIRPQVPMAEPDQEIVLDSTDTVSTANKCQTCNAMQLSIHDLAQKLKLDDTYHIGGTFSASNEQDLWFYFTTSVCPGFNYLLNLFVCHKKTGCFSVHIHKADFLDSEKYTFKSSQKDEHHYIKTICFFEDALKSMDNDSYLISITLTMDDCDILNSNVVNQIKLNHDFGSLLTKQEKTDFVLESGTRKQFPVHKIVLASNSPVLRNIVKKSKTGKEFLDISDNDMDLLLQFVYSGTIQDVYNQDCLKLIEIAHKFQLKNLFYLIQHVLEKQINVSNAIELAVLSEKYNLEVLQNRVFIFIKNNDAVMETKAWKALDDVNLMKKLYQYKHQGILASKTV